MSGFNEWLGRPENPESEAQFTPPPADPLAEFEADVTEVPESRLLDPWDQASVKHLTRAEVEALVPLLDTVRGRLLYVETVKGLKRAGHCQGCVSAVTQLLKEERTAWGLS